MTLPLRQKLLIGLAVFSLTFPILAMLLYLTGNREASIVLLCLILVFYMLKYFQAIGGSILLETRLTGRINELSLQADNQQALLESQQVLINKIIIGHNKLVVIVSDSNKLYVRDKDTGELKINELKVN